MKIIRDKFKDVNAIKLSGKNFDAVYLHENGGKLVSFKDKATNTEWLAQDENENYIPQSTGGIYIEAEVSGADEMFPTIDPCMGYPCHGEVCRVPHNVVVSDERLTIEYTSKKFMYKYKKTISETDCGNMKIEYEIENTGRDSLPCLWAFHMMFAAEDGGRAFAEVEKTATAEIIFDDTGRFGKKGDIISLDDKLLTSREYKENGDAYKYYISEPVKEGKCGYFRPDKSCGVALCYDMDKLPYLGIWMNDGGFKNMYSATVEPCNLPFDSPENAKKRGFEFLIHPGEKMEFDIVLKMVEKI